MIPIEQTTIYSQVISADSYNLPKDAFHQIVAKLIIKQINKYFEYISNKPDNNKWIIKMNEYYHNASLINQQTVKKSLNQLQNPLKDLNIDNIKNPLAKINQILQKECLLLTDEAYGEEANLYNLLKKRTEQDLKQLLYQIYSQQFGLSPTLMKRAYYTSINLAISYLLDNSSEQPSDYGYGTQNILKWIMLYLNYNSQIRFIADPAKAKESLKEEENLLFDNLLIYTLEEGNLTKQQTVMFPNCVDMPDIKPF